MCEIDQVESTILWHTVESTSLAQYKGLFEEQTNHHLKHSNYSVDPQQHS